MGIEILLLFRYLIAFQNLVLFFLAVICCILCLGYGSSLYLSSWCLQEMASQRVEIFLFLERQHLCVFLGYYKHPYLPIFVSVGLVMVTCFGLLLYHIYQQIKATKVGNKIIKWMPVHLRRFHKPRKTDCKTTVNHSLMMIRYSCFVRQSLATFIKFYVGIL